VFFAKSLSATLGALIAAVDGTSQYDDKRQVIPRVYKLEKVGKDIARVISEVFY